MFLFFVVMEAETNKDRTRGYGISIYKFSLVLNEEGSILFLERKTTSHRMQTNCLVPGLKPFE